MSQENVELVREGNAAFRRGDWDAVAANLDRTSSSRPMPAGPSSASTAERQPSLGTGAFGSRGA
jgi:hypothetical protein